MLRFGDRLVTPSGHRAVVVRAHTVVSKGETRRFVQLYHEGEGVSLTVSEPELMQEIIDGSWQIGWGDQ